MARESGPPRSARSPSQSLQFDISKDAVWSVVGGPANDTKLGEVVAFAGDVNADGLGDVLISSSDWEVGGVHLGMVAVHHGSTAGLGTIPSAVLHGDQEYANFGGALAGAGDVNGDGYDDLLVGAASRDPFGGTSLFVGSAAGVDPVPAWVGESDQSAGYGSAITFVGDTNDDGFTDVAVGADDYEVDASDFRGAGRAYAYLGSPDGPDDPASWTGDGVVSSLFSSYGASLASGDVNGDGYSDLIVGSVEEAAHVYAGSPTGLGEDADWVLERNGLDYERYADSVAAGDVNGDGYDDVVVSSPPAFASDEIGQLYVFHGSSTGPDPDVQWILEAPAAVNSFATAVAAGGDLDGDGYDEVVVAGTTDEYDVSLFWAYRGSATGLGTSPICSATGDGDDDFGRSVAFVDNVDGQGAVDILVGAPYHDGVGHWVGRVDLFPGGLCIDFDGDGSPNDEDLCDGADATGDADGDHFCAMTVDGAIHDCDETDANVFPGAFELCDGKDDACTGFVPADELDLDADGTRTCDGDCDDGDPSSWPGAAELCDGADNSCAGSIPPDESDADLDGFLVCEGDCNDHFATDFPGAPELCDGIDNSCSGMVPTDETDADGDGFWPCQGDCDDAHPGSFFGAPEVCDGAHNDCTGSFPADELDADSDGFHPCDGDCDDSDAAVWPGAPERCDGMDTTCAGLLPVGESDVDGDGALSCEGDCDDHAANVAPHLQEECGDLLDNDCDGRVNEECDEVPSSSGKGCHVAGGNPEILLALFLALALLARVRRAVPSMVVLRAAPPALLTLAWEQGSFDEESLLGFSVASAGDVNGDGYDDVVAGAPYPLVYASYSRGAAALWLGGAAGLGPTPAWRVEGEDVGSPCHQMWYGVRVAAAGDVDGDGFDDVAVGSDDWAGVYYGSSSGLSTGTGFEEGWGSCLSKYGIYFGYGWVISSLGDVNGDGFDDVAFALENYNFGQGGVIVHHGSQFGLELTYQWFSNDEYESYFGRGVDGADVNGDGYDDMIVGARGIDTVFVYDGSSAGLETAPSFTIEMPRSVEFGWSVAGAGDVNADGYEDVVISEPFTVAGSVFVFHGSHAGLERFAATELSLPAQPDATYGYQVAPAGDVDGDGFDDLAIGAPTYDAAGVDEGAVFVHRGSPAGIQSVAAWSASITGQTGAWFGNAVTSAGDVDGDGFHDLVVGAPYYDSGPREDEGRVYVFTGDAFPCVGDRASGDEDGDGVCLLDHDGTVEDCDDTDAGVWPGAEELCDGRDTSCSGSVPDDELDEDADGFVGCAGDCDDADPASYPGAVELCDGRDNTCAGAVPADEIDADVDGWSPCAGDCDDTKAFTRPDIAEICGDVYDNDCDGAADEECTDASAPDEGCSCGTTPAGGGAPGLFLLLTVAVVARRRIGLLALTGCGVEPRPQGALLHHNMQGDMTPDASWVIESTVYGANLGTAAASAGDVNGDGFSDVIVGVPSSAPGGVEWQDFGYVSVYAGSADGLDLMPVWTVQDDEVGTGFGSVASPAGDVDADGFDDVALVAFDVDVERATAMVYLGSAAGLDVNPAWTASATVEVTGGGRSVGSAGDVNGDGYGDLLFREDAYFTVDPSFVHVYHGSATGLEQEAGWTAEGETVSDFGAGAASAGDVDGDGYGDLVVGAPLYDAPDANEGVAFVYLGGPDGLQTEAGWTAESDQEDATFGTAAAGAGDVDGDGYDDVLTGAPYWSDPETHEGGVWMFRGGATGPESTASLLLETNLVDAYLGRRVGPAGDVDGQGYADLLLVAPGHPDGSAFVHLGSPTGPSSEPACVLDVDSTGWDNSVATAGDVDGDGFDDLVVGVPDYDAVEANVGIVYVFSGSRCTDIDLDGVLNADDVCFGDDPTGDADTDAFCALDVEGAVEDCDETDPDVYPGAAELCDGKDTACDGVLPEDELDEDRDGSVVCGGECDDLDPTVFPGAPELCDRIDNTCAGFLARDELDLDEDGFTPCEGDCNDSDVQSYPGAFEYCDGVDNACAGSIPADELDQDGDGLRACAGDCDDTDPATLPGAPEICDGVVNDCVGVLRADEWDVDLDGVWPCNGDCDDTDASSWPGAPELCDGIDNDCSGEVLPDEVDSDRDGSFSCGGDCDDRTALVAPESDETCDDQLDNNCDGTVDEGCSNADPRASGSCSVAGPAAVGWPLLIVAPWLGLRATRRGPRGLRRPPCTPSSWRSTSRCACS